MSQKRRKIPAGFKNGHLEFVCEAPDRVIGGYRTRWVVARCVCGSEREYLMTNFYNGGTRSCGCMTKKWISDTLKSTLREKRGVTRDIETMRLLAMAADKKRRNDICDKISEAESNCDYAKMMEWTLVFLDRSDKSEILVQEEDPTVGNFVFE